MFNEAVTTIKGMRLNTKIQAGQCLMNFTKIKLGKGLHGEDELLEDLEALFEIQQEVSISRVEVMSENTVKISTVISNEGMEEGFYISEIGVFAEDPDEGEILYSVAVGTEGKMDYHPSYAEMSNYSLSLDMYIAVSNAEKISIDTVPGAAASAEELRELEEKVEALENVEFEDYTGEDSAPPDARTAISRIVYGIKHSKFVEYTKAALMGMVTLGEMRGLLVNHGLCTEPGKFFLDAAYGKYLTDQITQLNSDHIEYWGGVEDIEIKANTWTSCKRFITLPKGQYLLCWHVKVGPSSIKTEVCAVVKSNPSSPVIELWNSFSSMEYYEKIHSSSCYISTYMDTDFWIDLIATNDIIAWKVEVMAYQIK